MNQVFTWSEVVERWGGALEALPKNSFNLEDVPEGLRPLGPYAEIWGAADDWVREDVLKKTPVSLRRNLKAVVVAHEDALDEWLGGVEAADPNPSDAYVAYSAMRMSADFI